MNEITTFSSITFAVRHGPSALAKLLALNKPEDQSKKNMTEKKVPGQTVVKVLGHGRQIGELRERSPWAERLNLCGKNDGILSFMQMSYRKTLCQNNLSCWEVLIDSPANKVDAERLSTWGYVKLERCFMLIKEQIKKYSSINWNLKKSHYKLHFLC